jgi:hypothetical protein
MDIVLNDGKEDDEGTMVLLYVPWRYQSADIL